MTGTRYIGLGKVIYSMDAGAGRAEAADRLLTIIEQAKQLTGASIPTASA